MSKYEIDCKEVAEEWLERPEAPVKKLIWFENSAHSPQWEEAEEWNRTFESLFGCGVTK